MAKNGKKFIKPGSLAHQKKTGYEMLRDTRVKENHARIESLGIKRIISSMKDSHHPKCTNEKGKVIRNGADDSEYRLSNDEDDDDDDDDSVHSFQNEIIEMAPGRHGRSSLETQRRTIFDRNTVVNPTQPNLSTTQVAIAAPLHFSTDMARCAQPSLSASPLHLSTEMAPCAEPSLSPDGQPQNEATMHTNVAHHRRTRGITRGVLVQKEVGKIGKLTVPIPQEFRAPIGDNASKLVSKIGVEIRSGVQDLTVKHWKAVDEAIKAPIIQRVKDQFDMLGDPIDVNKVIATKCGRRLSDHTYRLHKKFQKLKETKGEGYARSHPPARVNMEQWIHLIDKKWNNPNWKDRSRKNTDNRAKLKTKQRCGSKSIPVRVYEHIESHGGELPKLPEFYKLTHHNAITDEWISPQCEINYERMLQMQLEYSQDGQAPPTNEQLSVGVLLPRSGYVKGLGLRPSSTIRSTAGSGTANDYVTRLEKKIESQNEKIKELLEANTQQQEVTAKMIEFLREKGILDL